jgi:hypothetical protein
MKQLMMAATLVLLGACDRGRTVVGGTAVVEVVPLPVLAEVIVEATNYDPVDYALWLEWQDDAGTWNQTFLFSVFGDPYFGPTQDFADLLVPPGTVYILLADPAGNLFDTQVVWLPAGSVLDLHYQIASGFLARLS